MIDKLLNYGDNYNIVNIIKESTKNLIFLKSKTTCCRCPKCNIISNEIHSTYKRTIQDTPIQNTETWIMVNAHEYKCLNEKCEVKTFNEILPFARKNKVMTDNLIQFILSISIFMSSSATSLILSFLGVKVSADTIDRIIHNIKIVDNPNIEAIGIDDVAIRKGQNYATAIYDLNDHHLIALLEGRDSDNVKEWLKEHKKIKVVARDRASAYATAISEILPNCVQIADKFHLFQNLTEYLRDIFYKDLPEKIFIQSNQIVDEKSIKKIPIKTEIDKLKLEKLDYDNSIPLDTNGNPITFNNKLLSESSGAFKKWEEKRIEKMKKIKMMRKRYNETKCYKIVMDEFKVSRNALKKYVKMTDYEVEQIANVNEHTCGRVLDDFINMIYKMMLDKIPIEYIIEYIFRKGYKGTRGTLNGYIVNLAKNNNLNYYNCSKILFKNTNIQMML